MKIVLSGPDGTGKSTIVKGLMRRLTAREGVRVTWRRFGFVFARFLNLAAKGLGLSFYEETPYGPVGYHRYRGTFSRIYIMACFMDSLLVIVPKWWIHDRVNHSKTQIVDRYLIDIVADVILSTGDTRSVLYYFDGLLKRHIHSSNCVLLSCDPEIVMARRPDIAYDKSYLKKVRIYSLLRRLYGIPQLSTDNATPEACIERALILCES